MYTTFKNRWLGKITNPDGVYGYQCVDLIKRYAIDELGAKPGAWGNAIQYSTRPASSFLKLYTRVASPKQGDIVIFEGGKYGHIGLVDAVSARSIYTLEQNGSTGNGNGLGGNKIRLRWIPRSRVAAYYRPISKPVNKPVNKPTKGKDMLDIQSAEMLANMANPNRKAGEAGNVKDLKKNHVGKDANMKIKEWFGSAERKAALARERAADAKQVKTIAAMQKVVDQLSVRPTRKDYAKAVADMKTLSLDLEKTQVELKAARSKPAVIKEVEKIVQVEKIINAPLNWKRVIDWVIKQIKHLDIRKGQ